MSTEFLIRWTARAFVACYLGRVCIDVAGRRDASSQRAARWMWTVGCGVCLLHIGVSLHFAHGWSQVAAYDHVLKRTGEMTGISTGFGLFINYAFALMWLVDTVLWWRRLDWSEQRLAYWIVQGTFAFLISQATVVFGPPFWMPFAAALAVVLITLRCFRRSTAFGGAESVDAP